MLALLEAELLEPREEGALPPATGLGHAVDGLDHLAAHLEAFRVLLGEALRGVAIHDFSRFELTLKVGSNEVPSAHAISGTCGEASKYAKRRGPESGAVGLIVVDAGRLSAALHAEARLELAGALHLEDPD